jgi:hypothetical protein
VRDKNDPNDIFAIDGLKLTDRTSSMVKRDVYDRFPDENERTQKREWISKIYKKYLRKYLTEKERQAHPWTRETANDIAKEQEANESVYTRIHRGIIKILDQWGIKCKAEGGQTILTTSHWGYITSKVTSDFYRGLILTNLLQYSKWGEKIPKSYDFFKNEQDLLNNTNFKDSMFFAYTTKVSGFNPGYMLIGQSL